MKPNGWPSFIADYMMGLFCDRHFVAHLNSELVGQGLLVSLHNSSAAILVYFDPLPEAHSPKIFPIEGDVHWCRGSRQVRA